MMINVMNTKLQKGSQDHLVSELSPLCCRLHCFESVLPTAFLSRLTRRSTNLKRGSFFADGDGFAIQPGDRFLIKLGDRI